MKRYFVHTGVFQSSAVRIVWWEDDPPDPQSGMSFSSILKAFPLAYRDMALAFARVEQLNSADIAPAELMAVYTHLHQTGQIVDLTGKLIADVETDLEFFRLIEQTILERTKGESHAESTCGEHTGENQQTEDTEPD